MSPRLRGAGRAGILRHLGQVGFGARGRVGRHAPLLPCDVASSCPPADHDHGHREVEQESPVIETQRERRSPRAPPAERFDGSTLETMHCRPEPRRMKLLQDLAQTRHDGPLVSCAVEPLQRAGPCSRCIAGATQHSAAKAGNIGNLRVRDTEAARCARTEGPCGTAIGEGRAILARSTWHRGCNNGVAKASQDEGSALDEHRQGRENRDRR